MIARAVSVTLCAALTIVGCGGSDEGSAATTSPSITSTSPATTSVTSTPVEVDSTTSTAVTSTTTSITTSTAATSTTTRIPTAAPTIDEIIAAGTTLNLAHAGGDQDAPHSTRFAFSEAVIAGANALELDVQLTADGVLIVQHDDTVDKTTEATGPVGALTLAEIQALDNAYWFSPECWPCRDRPVEEYVYRGVRTGDVPPPSGYSPDDFRVPTFREIATSFPNVPLDIEIKGSLPQAAAVAERLATEIAELGRTDSVAVVSFDDAVIDEFHRLAPDVAVSPGLGRLTAWFLDGAELEPHFVILQLPPFQGDIEVVNADVVQRIHDEGRVVWVWADDAATQENETFYRALLGYGVDGIIAGRPGAMTAALGS